MVVVRNGKSTKVGGKGQQQSEEVEEEEHEPERFTNTEKKERHYPVP